MVVKLKFVKQTVSFKLARKEDQTSWKERITRDINEVIKAPGACSLAGPNVAKLEVFFSSEYL